MAKGYATLNARQEKFCIEYIKCNTIQEAMINAGYSERYAKSHYLDMMNNPLIKAKIKELMADMHSKQIAEAEEVLAFLSSVMRGELQEEIVMNERGKAVKVKKEVDMKDRIKSAELLAKKYKMLSDKVEIEANVQQQVVFVGGDELPEDEELIEGDYIIDDIQQLEGDVYDAEYTEEN